MDPTARTNLLWAALLVEECGRCGVTDFFIAPGSRSTSVVAAVARNRRVTSHVHYDERGTAFAALGYARATGRPAAWVTTSGTAVANGLPAVVEASTDGVPMLLLTADRPPELRRTGANQAVDQPGIFGGYVRWEFDVPAPEPQVDPASLLTVVDQAIHRARRAPAGPVHLNLMFREPLIPAPDADPTETPKLLRSWHRSTTPYTTYPTPRPIAPDAELREFASKLRETERGIIVAGRLRDRAEGEAAAKLASHLGWPLFADIGSQVRLGHTSENLVLHYDLALLDGASPEAHRPEAVVQFGSGSVSKRLGQFIAKSRPETHAVVREDPSRLDPNHIVSHYFEAGIPEFCKGIFPVSDGRPLQAGQTGEWLSGWIEASGRVSEVVSEGEGEAGDRLLEPFVARVVARELPPGSGLVVASSLPVRDMDSYAEPVPGRGYVPVAVNRGASGIDGTVATAAGFSLGHGGPVTLLIGDLALLHDLNSLAMLRNLPVTVVVVNNDGGGIFSMLPIARHEEFFETYFGTPHGLGFEDAARMFGLAYRKPHTMSEFRGAYRDISREAGPGIIEVVTDRDESVELRRKLAREIAEG
ncbi:MAG: 2-succinyl-5-enolpyruvyl-6-hydroxy-3-cyclohexene-1-carboxylic-acid synthase [Rubrobacter sp.]